MLVSISTMPAGEKYLEYVKQIESFADFVHLDVCDGQYNSTKCFLPEYATKINQNSTLPMDCHLMTKNAVDFAEKYIKAGANIVTAQIESFESENDILEYINFVKTHNSLCGLSLEISTDIDAILPYIQNLDVVLLMAVKTGQSGQKFDETIIAKIQQLDKIRQQKKLGFKIQVDGGIDDKVSNQLKQNNVDIVVSGSYVFTSKNRAENINLLK